MDIGLGDGRALVEPGIEALPGEPEQEDRARQGGAKAPSAPAGPLAHHAGGRAGLERREQGRQATVCVF